MNVQNDNKIVPCFKKLILFIFLIEIVAVPVFCQRVQNVSAEVDYLMPETQSLHDAKATAIKYARIQALADEFGMVVSQNNTIASHQVNGEINSTFNSYSETDVRGVWIEDTKEPDIQIICNNEKILIRAKVYGKAHELKSNLVELDVKTLSYGNSNGEQNPFQPGFETTHFKSGDFYGVRFRSAADGYVAIFLREDDNGVVNTQVPYDVGGDGYARVVKSNKEYVFMSNEDPEFASRYTSSTYLLTDRDIEHNTLIVVFSKKRFHMGLTDSGEPIKERFSTIELQKFQKWLHNLRKHDETVQVKEIVLTIEN